MSGAIAQVQVPVMMAAMWLLFAFSGPVLWAASMHIDKYLVDKYFQKTSTAVLMVFNSVVDLLALPVIWYFIPGVLAVSPLATTVMTASGALYVVAMLFYLQAIQTEEASVVGPLFQGAVLWGALLAYLLLGETLSQLQIVGGAFIVTGALILSLSTSGSVKNIRLRLVLTMLACTFSLALSSVIFKYFAVGGEFWVTTFWTYVGAVAAGAGLLATRGRWQQFVGLFRAHPGAMVGVNAANEVINLGGGLGVRYALLLAPVSLVQAISSTTTLFVFCFGVLLSRFFPSLGREDLSASNLLRKGAAALLVAIGIVLINPSQL
jgi:drug/metabolite transporter (DMT)-like permease